MICLILNVDLEFYGLGLGLISYIVVLVLTLRSCSNHCLCLTVSVCISVIWLCFVIAVESFSYANQQSCRQNVKLFLMMSNNCRSDGSQ